MFDRTQVVFRNNYIGVLATVDDDGTPRATPLHVATDGVAIYWFSHDSTTHSVNITRSPRVSLSLSSAGGGKWLQGVYVTGNAERLSVADRPMARRILQQRLGFTLPMFGSGSAFRLPIGELNTHKSTSNCWYFYTPKS